MEQQIWLHGAAFLSSTPDGSVSVESGADSPVCVARYEDGRTVSLSYLAQGRLVKVRVLKVSSRQMSGEHTVRKE